MSPGVEVVFFDVGGPIYDDRPYYDALWRAISEARPDASEAVYREEFEAARRDQNGSFTRRLVSLFVDPAEVERVIGRGRELWEYPSESLLPDVRPALERLRGVYRLGVLANQEAWIRETLRRDGLDGFFQVWVVSAEVGIEKPDPRIFDAAIDLAGEPAERCVMVGDRLDNDIVPARARGFRTVWLLRGEAPEKPTGEQLGQTDEAIETLAELPAALGRL